MILLTNFTHGEGAYCISHYDEKCLPPILNLEQAANPYPWTENNFVSSLRAKHWCLALQKSSDQELIGHAVLSFAAGEAELLIVALHPAEQGRGLARAFLSAIVLHLARRAQTLFLEVRESNSAAIAAYDALGFNQVGVRPKYYPASTGRAEDALIYALDLQFAITK